MSSPQNLRRTFMKNWFAVEVGYLVLLFVCALICFLLGHSDVSGLPVTVIDLERLDFCIQLRDYWRSRSWC